MKRLLSGIRRYGGLGVLALLVIALAALPPEPAYGPYSRLDLISFTDYRPIPVADVVDSERELMRMISQLGLSRTMQKVADDPVYTADAACHGAAHTVGRAAFTLMGVRVLEECTTDCFSGCYHGALQGMGMRAGSLTALTTDIQELCSARPTGFERTECFHGAGHGFLLYFNYQLDDALTACRALSPHTADCFSGTFMEHYIGDSSEARFKRDDLHYPCNQYREAAVEDTCYWYQPDHFLRVLENDFSLAARECLNAPGVAQATCFRRLGQLAGADTENPPGNTEAFCASVPDRFYDACILGGLREVIRVNGIDPSGTAASFCHALATPRAKQVCYADYAAQLPDIFTDQQMRLRICDFFEEPYGEACRLVQ